MPQSNPILPETALDLWNSHALPIQWLVKDLLAEGLTILAGRPKSGKSYLILGIILAVASNHQALEYFETQHKSVLYLALEDGRPRIWRRLREVWKYSEPPPPNLFLFYQWSRGKQAVADLRTYLTSHREVRLVVIDTLAKVQPLGQKAGYQADYDTIEAYQKLALELGVSIVIVTHTRKPRSEDSAAADPLDEVQHTSGLTGAADAVLVMKRQRGRSEATLSVIGRDVDEQTYSLKSEPGSRRWEIEVEAEADPDKGLSQDRRRVRRFIRQAGEAQRIQALRDCCGDSFFSYSKTTKLLSRMEQEGLVIRLQQGLYTLPELNVSNVSNCQNAEETPIDTPF